MTRSSDAAGRPTVVGDEAPDFELPGGGGAPRRLRDLRGTPVVLAFYPGTYDAGWAEAVQAHDDSGELLSQRGVHLYGIAAEDHREVARLYGVAKDGEVIVIDENGRIARRHGGTGDGANMARAVWTRREFVGAAVSAALALALARPHSAAGQLAVVAPSDGAREHASAVTLDVNGRSLTLELDTRVTLLDALRDHAGITGPKKGCDHGQCGACTVHVNGRRVLSCLTFAAMQQGKTITTVEGLAHGDALHPLQRAFIEHDGFQCGYCTSGQLMSAAGMLDEPWGPGDDDVREAMSGNICRCGAYPGIVAAIQQVRTTGRAAQ